MRLTDFAFDKDSQFGEDGMIAHIFSKIGERSRVCVEFGAADGLTCSNTKQLWENSWEALLIEGDPWLYDRLTGVTKVFPKIIRSNTYVTATGENSIDYLLWANHVTEVVDFMSMDIDGNEYPIWAEMGARPRVVCVEYNESIPPQYDIRQKDPSGSLGTSALAMARLGASLGYELIGLNAANMIFVVKEEADPFMEYERDLAQLFPYQHLAYIATDYNGRAFRLGTPPWGLNDEPLLDEVIGDQISVIGPYLDLVKYFEAKEGESAVFIRQDWGCAPGARTTIGEEAYDELFGQGNPLIIIDVANQPNIQVSRWIEEYAVRHGYKNRIVEDKLFVFTKEGK